MRFSRKVAVQLSGVALGLAEQPLFSPLTPDKLRPHFIVVVPEGGSEEKDGVILTMNSSTTFAEFVTLVSSKLELESTDFRFCNGEGVHLTTLDAIQKTFVVYVSTDTFRQPIPGPAPYPLLGNLDVFLGDLVGQEHSVLTKYNHLVTLTMLGQETVVTSDPKYAQHFLTESEYFSKRISYPLGELQAVAGNGLFTSDTDTEEWHLAHKLLMPAFSASAIRGYIRNMAESASKAVRIFDKFADNQQKFPITHWTTNIALETIATVGFGYNFNLLESTEPTVHPFVQAIHYTLTETFNRMVLSPYWKYLPLPRNYEFRRQVKLMTDTVDNVIQERRAQPELCTAKKDILGYMLNTYDLDNKGNKRYIQDVNIRDQVLTFLIAGHETTSNTMSWCLYLLNNHPNIKHRVLQEIDEANLPTDDLVTAQHIAKLTYLTQCIKETLRLYPPVFTLIKQCIKDAVLPGGYEVKAGTPCQTMTYALHRHPDHWGPNPDEFNPDHFTPEAIAKRHPYAWMPFSTGPRACIGMQFALQEIKIVLAYLLRRFDFSNVSPEPVTWDRSTITLKPLDLRMTVRYRTFTHPCMPPTGIPRPLNELNVSSQVSGQSVSYLASKLNSVFLGTSQDDRVNSKPRDLPHFTLLYGSNMGMSEEYARQLGSQLDYLGCTVRQLASLDEWVQDRRNIGVDGWPTLAHKPPDRMHYTVFIASTYNGLAPDNAVKFHRYLQNLVKEAEEDGGGSMTSSTTLDEEGKPFRHLQYALFGCGNSQWRTFQAFPRFIKHCLSTLGGRKIFPSGRTDSDLEDTDQVFLDWSTELVSDLFLKLGVRPQVKETPSHVQPTTFPHRSLTGKKLDEAVGLEWHAIPKQISSPWLGYQKCFLEKGYTPVTVISNRQLRSPDANSGGIYHVELRPSRSLDYRPGDHLEIAPQNQPELVERVGKALGLELDKVYSVSATCVELEGVAKRALVKNIPPRGTVRDTLIYYADLTGPLHSPLVYAVAKAQVQESLGSSLEPVLLTLLRVDQIAWADLSLVRLLHYAALTHPQLCRQAQKEIQQRFRTVAEFLLESADYTRSFTWADWLVQLYTMTPRRYSIASCQAATVTQSNHFDVHLTVAVVRDRYQGRLYPGLTSDYLATSPNPQLWVRKQQHDFPAFHLAPLAVPVIMIGAGSGIAPFRGFLQERGHQKDQKLVNATRCPMLLYFGCRNPQQDYLYREELEHYVRINVLDRLTVAFSRCDVSDHTQMDVTPLQGIRCEYNAYVQQCLKQDGAMLWDLWNNQNAKLYVCGSTKLDAGVWEALLALVQEHGYMLLGEAEQYLLRKKESGHYLQDVWSP
ncbi:hypothetical protein IWQ62_003868 [Dispira parvispora]|uniref:NADPH--hemoprotein reductase n=1 Tax=Dispira parvispora TaxID=1520584 RepID=A0A9W8AQZ1_9FUNG|nr:hypothetical protein IWQ62_003868 [Dispira parvispora]